MNSSDILQVYVDNANLFLAVGAQIDMLDYIEQSHRDKINRLLNDLSGLDYRILQIADIKLTHQLFSAITNIPVAEDTLVVKACGLITVILNKQKQTLHIGLLTRVLDWLLAFIQSNVTADCCVALRSIQRLITANSDALAELNGHRVTALLMRLLSLVTKTRMNGVPNNQAKYDSGSVNEIRVVAVVCLESCCSRMPIIEPTALADIFQAILRLAGTAQPNDFDPQDACVFITSLLNICKNIILSDKSLAVPNIGDLLGIARSYIMYGLPDVVWTKPTRINVSQQAMCEPLIVGTTGEKGGKIAKTRKVKTASKERVSSHMRNSESKTNGLVRNEPIAGNNDRQLFVAVNYRGFGTITSESDFSESEVHRDQLNLQKQAHLRHSAITLIGVIGNSIPTKVVFGYWHSLFPTQEAAVQTMTHPSVPLTLLSTVTRDPNPRCRIASMQSIMSVLSGSKCFLTLAENSNRVPTAYTPFSLALGDMIITIYRTLLQAVANESSLPVLLQVLKCLTVLIQVTTFTRLNTDFIPTIVQHMRKLIRHNDSNIQVAAYRVLQELIASNDKSPEIADLIGVAKENNTTPAQRKARIIQPHDDEVIEINEEEGYDSDDLESFSGPTESQAQINHKCHNEISWLLEIALENLQMVDRKVPIPLSVRNESLYTISTMARYFVLLKEHLALIGSALQPLLVDKPTEPTQDIRLNVVKCIDILGHFINVYVSNQVPAEPNIQNAVFNFWDTMLPPIIEIMQDDGQTNALRSTACEAISNICSNTFERFTRIRQIQLIAVLSLSASKDVECSVRGAAIRTLGIYVMFPSLRDDMCYIGNTTESIIGSLMDGNLDIRVKSSWALGNLTNALLINCSDPNIECIHDSHLRRLFESISCSMSNDKVRSNVVRAMGNLLRLIRTEHLEHEFWCRTVLETISKIQLYCTGPGNMKVKWNACYAMGNFMHNQVLYEPNARPGDWMQLVVPTLCGLIITHPNFKVRINAAAALAVPAERTHVQEHFVVIWKSLFEALEQSDHMSDFAEYQHRDNLVDQLCITIAHYLRMSTACDMITISEQLQCFDTIHDKWVRVISRIVPERATALLSATHHLKSIEPTMEAHRAALYTVNMCFVTLDSY